MVDRSPSQACPARLRSSENAGPRRRAMKSRNGLKIRVLTNDQALLIVVRMPFQAGTITDRQSQRKAGPMMLVMTVRIALKIGRMKAHATLTAIWIPIHAAFAAFSKIVNATRRTPRRIPASVLRTGRTKVHERWIAAVMPLNAGTITTRHSHSPAADRTRNAAVIALNAG